MELSVTVFPLSYMYFVSLASWSSMVEWEALRSAGPQTCSPIIEISISCAHMEHLIVGRKPDILLVSAMVLRSQVFYSGYCNMRWRPRLSVRMRIVVSEQIWRRLPAPFVVVVDSKWSRFLGGREIRRKQARLRCKDDGMS